MLKRFLKKSRRGQAMVEYTMVSHVLLIGGAAATWPFMSFMMKGMNLYYQSIFWMLSTSVP
jgi:hypothetical protein